MAKTTVTKHKFYVVDLIRKKPKLEYIEIPKYRVDVSFEITTSGKLRKPDPVPSTALKRFEAAGMKELERYEKIITEESVKLDKKIGVLMKTPGPKAQAEAEKLIQGVNMSIKNALNSAEGAAQVAIQKQIKVESNKDKLLKEARVKTTLKVTYTAIKISLNTARLVASSGADADAWKRIAKDLYSLGKELQQQLKGEEKLRKELISAIQKYIDLRGTAIMQAAERQGITDTSGISVKRPMEAFKKFSDKLQAMGDEINLDKNGKPKDPKKVAKDMLDFTIKAVSSYNKDADKKRKFYREHTTKTRNKVDSLGLTADKLMKSAKAQKTLKDGIRIGAECMSVKRTASAVSAKLEERQKFLAEMESLMVANGLKVDDTTFTDKVKNLDKMTILKEAKNTVTSVKGIYKLVDKLNDAI